jgi:hypothetical protein
MGGLKPDEVRVGRRTQRGRWCLRGEKIFAFSLKLAWRKMVENEVSDFSGQADLHSYSLRLTLVAGDTLLVEESRDDDGPAPETSCTELG